jgi:hypothetical protein
VKNVDPPALTLEWPKGEAEPIKYWLSTLLKGTSLEMLVGAAMMRWRIERDYQELKQKFGLAHFEGRGWRGFHHHATLCIAAYGIFDGASAQPQRVRKTPLDQKCLSYPTATRRAAAGRMQRHVPDSIPTLRDLLARRIARDLKRCPCCGVLKNRLRS